MKSLKMDIKQIHSIIHLEYHFRSLVFQNTVYVYSSCRKNWWSRLKFVLWCYCYWFQIVLERADLLPTHIGYFSESLQFYPCLHFSCPVLVGRTVQLLGAVHPSWNVHPYPLYIIDMTSVHKCYSISYCSLSNYVDVYGIMLL